MEFKGPDPADFSNVHSLNYAFLDVLRDPIGGKPFRGALSQQSAAAVGALTDLQARRLANVPFLLFSLRERDHRYWTDLLTDDPNRDLFVSTQSQSIEVGRLVATALAFLWQLSIKNPYAARVASGATLNWCEGLADVTLIHLLQRTAGHCDMLEPRLCDNDKFWTKLLVAGVSSEPEVRSAAHHCALQTLLTTAQNSGYRRLPAAACSMPVPALQVADATRRSSPRKKS